MVDKGTNTAEEKNAPPGGALVVVPKNNEDLVEEEIDSQILSIIGLEDVFDLTYEEYATLLKEAAVRGRMPSSQMSTEAVELVTNELKRVRGNTGRFKVKRGKVNIDKVMNRRAPSPQRILPQSLAPPEEENETEKVKKFLMGNLPDRLSLIADSLDDINKTLQQQLGIEKKVSETERKEVSKSKKAEREREIEKKDKKKSDEGIKKLKGPVTGFFDAIKRYFGNILAGSIVVGLVNWFQNPANKGAIDKFGNFITDNAPLILGGILALALLPVASTLIGFTGSILGGIGMLTKAIGGLGGLLLKIPGLGAAATAAAPAAAAIGISAVGAIGTALLMKATYDAIRGEIAGGGDFAKVDEQLRNKLAGYGITETGMAFKKGSRKQQKLSASQQKVYEEIQGKRDTLRKLKEERDAELAKHYTQRSPRSARVLTERGKEIKRKYDKKALELFGQEQPQVQPQTPAVTDYVSPFAGARDREALKASKITGNAPITVGEKAGYSASRGRVHAGRDIAAPSGTGLQVPSDSVITDKGVDGGYGNYVVFKDASGVEHLYGHMIEASPYNKGDQVPAGTVIGRVGSTGKSTGPHLHWEVSRVMSEVGRPRQNVIDPIEMGFPAQAPFTGKVEAAQIAQTKPTTPPIPSPTGRSGIGGVVPFPIGGQQQVTSGSSASQPTIPGFSAEDPNNTNIMTIKAIYNLVG